MGNPHMGRPIWDPCQTRLHSPYGPHIGMFAGINRIPGIPYQVQLQDLIAQQSATATSTISSFKYLWFITGIGDLKDNCGNNVTLFV